MPSMFSMCFSFFIVFTTSATIFLALFHKEMPEKGYFLMCFFTASGYAVLALMLYIRYSLLKNNEE